jgi:hypothetical protein
MAGAAPMEDMLLRLYVVGFCDVTTGTFEIKTPCRWCFWVLLLELLSHSTYQDAVSAKRKALVE